MKTILLVDDEEAIRTPLAELLCDADEELRVLPAANGREAINILSTKDVDLVITDLKMPVMDGFTLLAHLMRFHPSVPVIVITAYGTAETRSRLKVLGAVDYLEKPADFKALPGLVRARLTQRAKGYIVGVTLAGLLQLLNLEQKTCILSITSHGRIGQLSCLCGEMIHAQAGPSRGLDAMYEILAWRDPVIEIHGAPSIKERTIDAPIGHILLEAARRDDEARRNDAASPASEASPAAVQRP
jgi:CheY-like chemotaxis protein